MEVDGPPPSSSAVCWVVGSGGSGNPGVEFNKASGGCDCRRFRRRFRFGVSMSWSRQEKGGEERSFYSTVVSRLIC